MKRAKEACKAVWNKTCFHVKRAKEACKAVWDKTCFHVKRANIRYGVLQAHPRFPVKPSVSRWRMFTSHFSLHVTFFLIHRLQKHFFYTSLWSPTIYRCTVLVMITYLHFRGRRAWKTKSVSKHIWPIALLLWDWCLLCGLTVVPLLVQYPVWAWFVAEMFLYWLNTTWAQNRAFWLVQHAAESSDLSIRIGILPEKGLKQILYVQ